MEQIDPDSAQVREVFAHYGLAMYQAQCLEREIAIALSTVHGPGPKRITRDQLDQLYDKNFRKTLGSLVAGLRQTASVPGELEERLTQALTLRNWLTHNYFWERTPRFMKAPGREAMIQELLEAIRCFMEIDAQLSEITGRWAAAHGVTKELFQEAWDELLVSDEGLA